MSYTASTVQDSAMPPLAQHTEARFFVYLPGAGAFLQRPVGDRQHAGCRGREHRVQRRLLHVRLHAEVEEPRGRAVNAGGGVACVSGAAGHVLYMRFTNSTLLVL